MKEINISIAGLGNVGSHLVNTIEKNKDIVDFKSNIKFNIVGISAKNKNKKRIFNTLNYSWYDNPKNLLNIKNLDVFVELIGQEKGISFDLVKYALENKIHVVTANKALIAKNGSELFGIAEKNNVLLLYEAAVAGGIPIIKMLKNNIFLNNIKKISGILNGTTNFILTTMYEKNLTFNEALEIAKSKGYTSDSESELDIGGLDSAHKLTILATLSFGAKFNFDNNIVAGISNIHINDIINANKLGYKIKLISEVSLIDDKIYCETSPKLIDERSPMANVNGVLNAINIETDQLQSLFLEGEGAGGRATASSVISDLYEIISNSNISSLGYSVKKLINYKKLDTKEIESSYYIRIIAKDITGVLSKITSYFNESDISVEKIFQLPDSEKYQESIPIIITTHLVQKNKLFNSIKKIETQDFISEKISIIPICNN